MKNKRRKFLKHVIKTKEEFGLDDDTTDQWLVPEMEQREKSYKKRLINYVGKDFYKAGTKWWIGLSTKEKAQTGAETEAEILRAYGNTIPKGFDSVMAKKLTELDTKVPDKRFDPIGNPTFDEESGQVKPGKVTNSKRKPPHVPTQKEIETMSRSEIANAIKAIKEYNWPSGDSGDLGIDGVQGKE